MHINDHNGYLNRCFKFIMKRVCLNIETITIHSTLCSLVYQTEMSSEIIHNKLLFFLLKLKLWVKVNRCVIIDEIQSESKVVCCSTLNTYLIQLCLYLFTILQLKL